jgi:predicted glycoside hydrolase/deacetylase ChbG (UPF0249 family)
MKRLIVNADDLGITEGVNRGIIDCYRRGIVTSTTLMVNGEAVAGAAVLAAECPELGVGLHLNLTTGPPSQQPSLVPSLVGRDGCFPGKANMLARLSTGSVRREELEGEIEAQARACRGLDIEPTHLDSHHHIHAHPVVARALVRVCPCLGIERVRWYRAAPSSLKALGIRAVSLLSRPRGLRMPDRFAGIEEMGGRDMAEALRRELSRRGDTLEFMVHPGYSDQRLRRVSAYSDPRQVELAALLSREAVEAVEESGVRLVSFRGL